MRKKFIFLVVIMVLGVLMIVQRFLLFESSFENCLFKMYFKPTGELIYQDGCCSGRLILNDNLYIFLELSNAAMFMGLSLILAAASLLYVFMFLEAEEAKEVMRNED